MAPSILSLCLISAYFTATFASIISSTAICPADWSLDPPSASGTQLIHCFTPGAQSPKLCVPSRCSGHPVCSQCIDTRTQETFEQVACKSEFHASQGDQSVSICIDHNERYHECSGTCEGTLTCRDCVPEAPRFTAQLRKRANPFQAGMNGSGNGNNGFEGELNL